MPYRYASMFIAALIAATIFAFWRSYFGKLPGTSMGFHVHGITASLWMVLLLAQSWTPHRGRLAVHRALGRTTFVALPLFAAGSMAVLHSMAVATKDGDRLYALWGASLAAIDVLAFGAVVYAVGMALRHRRSVKLHAGYMLSSALPLVSPVFGRLFNRTIPGLAINGPQDFPMFGWSVQLANMFAGIIALWLWQRDPRMGAPWAAALAVVAVQIIGFEVAAGSRAWTAAFLWLGTLPLALLMLSGALVGVAAIVAGWTMPARRGGSQVALV